MILSSGLYLKHLSKRSCNPTISSPLSCSASLATGGLDLVRLSRTPSDLLFLYSSVRFSVLLVPSSSKNSHLNFHFAYQSSGSRPNVSTISERMSSALVIPMSNRFLLSNNSKTVHANDQMSAGCPTASPRRASGACKWSGVCHQVRDSVLGEASLKSSIQSLPEEDLCNLERMAGKTT